MLTQRLRTYGYHLKLKPRSRKLRDLEGYHTLSPKNTLYDEYRMAKSKLSFSRWLLKAKNFDADTVSRISKEVAGHSITVKLSCRYNDILRMSDTPHFMSCCAPRQLGSATPKLILKDSNAAIIYHPDKAGKFQGRCIIHLSDKGIIQILRCYGTVQIDAVKRLMESLRFEVNPHMDDTVSFYERAR